MSRLAGCGIAREEEGERNGDRAVADTLGQLVLYESGFAPRWYVPRADIVADASYYDVGDAGKAAWSYRTPFKEVDRIADLISFYPEKVTITIDGEKLEPVAGQTVAPPWSGSQPKRRRV
jgi:uncharacterized protein (DUF427 family)